MKVVDSKDINCVMLENHGALVFGRTVREAFVNLWYLEKLCETYLTLLSTGEELIWPDEKVVLESSALFDKPEYAPGNKEWAPMVSTLSPSSQKPLV